MADGKKGFMLYADQKHVIDLLTDEQAGILFKHILAYVNDENPTLLDPMLAVAFEPIKRQLKRDLKKREDRAQRSRENGALWGRPPWSRPPTQEPIKPNGLFWNPDEPKKPDIDNVTVNDTDNVSVNNTHTHEKFFDQKIEPSNEVLEPIPWFNELVASTAEATIYEEEQKKAPEEPTYDRTERMLKQRHGNRYGSYLAQVREKHTGKATLLTDAIKKRVITLSESMHVVDIEKFIESYGVLYNFIENNKLHNYIYYPIRQYDLDKFLEKVNSFTGETIDILINICKHENKSKVLAIWKKENNIVDEDNPPPPKVEEKVELTQEQKQKAKEALAQHKKKFLEQTTT